MEKLGGENAEFRMNEDKLVVIIDIAGISEKRIKKIVSSIDFIVGYEKTMDFAEKTVG